MVGAPKSQDSLIRAQTIVDAREAAIGRCGACLRLTLSLPHRFAARELLVNPAPVTRGARAAHRVVDGRLVRLGASAVGDPVDEAVGVGDALEGQLDAPLVHAALAVGLAWLTDPEVPADGLGAGEGFGVTGKLPAVISFGVGCARLAHVIDAAV